MKKNLIVSVGILLLLGLGSFASAQGSLNYIPLAPLPGASSTISTIGDYINLIFRLSIGLGSVLAVLMIVIGGAQYMSTDQIGGKSQGRETIKNALLGLLLLLISFLVLRTINPELVDLDVNITPVRNTAALNAGGLYHTIEFCKKTFVGNDNREVISPPCYPTMGACQAAHGTCGERESTVTFQDCQDCVSIENIEIDNNRNHCQTGGGERNCMLSRTVVERLESLQDALDGFGEVIITEAWPPTIQHQNPCHQNGTCLDFWIVPGTSLNIVNALSQWGNGLVYEVDRPELKQQILAELESDPALQELASRRICVVEKITGPHFSGYANPVSDCGG